LASPIAELELKQRSLNHELVADIEQLAKSGLARKSTYVEVKREEVRIDGNIGRLQSKSLRAELSIGDLQLRITELRNGYQRRVTTELRETERLLLELTVTLPAAHRLRAAYARQVGLLTAEQLQQPTITVIRAKGTTSVKYDATVEFLLQAGDVVQIGSLFPPFLNCPWIGSVHPERRRLKAGSHRARETSPQPKVPPLNRRSYRSRSGGGFGASPSFTRCSKFRSLCLAIK
jgi:hypothetical protein